MASDHLIMQAFTATTLTSCWLVVC